jgi:hypothetical protein
MKRPWVWPLLLGLLLGTLIGVGASLWAFAFLTGSRAKGTPFLEGFSFQEAAAKAGHPDWEMVEDRIYQPPGERPARPWAVSRRIIARATMPDKEQGSFAHKFLDAVKETIMGYGTTTGDFSHSSSGAHLVNGRMMKSDFNVPRLYYRIGSTEGVVDVSIIAYDGQVTAIVTWAE